MSPGLTCESRGTLPLPGERPARATVTFPSLTEGESWPNWPERSCGGVGIDRLSISFPVRGYAEPSRWDRASYSYRDGSQTLQATLRARDGGPGVMVGVRTVEGRPWGKVECNPARFWDPEGCELLPLRELSAALNVMWAAAGELTTPDCRGGEARVRRVDVARDFRGITSPGLYVEGLEPLHRAHARRKGVWSDAKAGNAQTLHVGSGAGMVRLYDQHAAYAEKGAPEGSLRFEAEARNGWLEKAGVGTVDALDAVVIERIAAERWEWSKMGTTVTGPVNAVQVLQRRVQAGDISRAVATRLAGEMLFQSFGYGAQGSRSERRYRSITDELGLTSASLWSNDLSRQASARLDFATGTEFLELTA